MMQINVYTMYRPAPSVVKKQLVRRLATKSLKNLATRGKRNINPNYVNTWILNRKFSYSSSLCTGKDLDPYSTYGESPIESDVEGSTQDLAARFTGDPSGLISEQTRKMESITEKSKLYIDELVQDRNMERSSLQDSELQEFDKNTKELVKEAELIYKDDLTTVAMIRDDALDLIDGQGRKHNSDYDSDYDSDTSVNRIQSQYANLDSDTVSLQNNHNNFIYNTLQNIPSNVNTHSSIEAGPSNLNPGINELHSLDATSKKRKHEDTDLESSAKITKMDNTMVSNKPQDLPVNNKSPLDYVLEKQMSDPYDFNDDID